MTSLEDFAAIFAAALNGEQNALWRAGEVVNLALAQSENVAGRALTKKERAAIFNAFATSSKCTAMRVKQLSTVAQAFEPGMRDRLPSWSHYRAARQSALRLSVMPADVVAEAELNDWGLREIAKHGSKKQSFLEFHGSCVLCEVKIHVKCREQRAENREVFCPTCKGHLGVLA